MIDNAQEWTISGARRQMAEMFRKSGIESPELDARVLVGHALGLEHAELASAAARILSRKEVDAINALAARRLRHEPVARTALSDPDAGGVRVISVLPRTIAAEPSANRAFPMIPSSSQLNR